MSSRWPRARAAEVHAALEAPPVLAIHLRLARAPGARLAHRRVELAARAAGSAASSCSSAAPSESSERSTASASSRFDSASRAAERRFGRGAGAVGRARRCLGDPPLRHVESLKWRIVGYSTCSDCSWCDRRHARGPRREIVRHSMRWAPFLSPRRERARSPRALARRAARAARLQRRARAALAARGRRRGVGAREQPLALARASRLGLEQPDRPRLPRRRRRRRRAAGLLPGDVRDRARFALERERGERECARLLLDEASLASFSRCTEHDDALALARRADGAGAPRWAPRAPLLARGGSTRATRGSTRRGPSETTRPPSAARPGGVLGLGYFDARLTLRAEAGADDASAPLGAVAAPTSELTAFERALANVSREAEAAGAPSDPLLWALDVDDPASAADDGALAPAAPGALYLGGVRARARRRARGRGRGGRLGRVPPRRAAALGRLPAARARDLRAARVRRAPALQLVALVGRARRHGRGVPHAAARALRRAARVAADADAVRPAAARGRPRARALPVLLQREPRRRRRGRRRAVPVALVRARAGRAERPPAARVAAARRDDGRRRARALRAARPERAADRARGGRGRARADEAAAAKALPQIVLGAMALRSLVVVADHERRRVGLVERFPDAAARAADARARAASPARAPRPPSARGTRASTSTRTAASSPTATTTSSARSTPRR